MSYQYLLQRGNPELGLLIAFHGTGGNERQLLGLAQEMAPEMTYLSPLGKELESGVNPRYFRRFAEGLLDVDDLKFRAGEIATWLEEVIASESIELRPRVAMGYSNGASISAGMLLLTPDAFDQVILLRPMVPFEPEFAPDLSGKRVLILASRTDTITPFNEAERLAGLLGSFGAEVTFTPVPGGHGLTQADVLAVRQFLDPPSQ